MTGQYGISSSEIQKYMDSIEVREVLLGSGQGTLAGGVYSATTDIYFKNQNRATPPIVFVFRYTSTNSESLPTSSVVLYPSLLMPLDGYVCTSWCDFEVYTNCVRIKSYSKTAFSENYAVLVVKDKQDNGQ